MRNEKGAVLIVMLVLLVVLTMLGMTAMTTTTLEAKMATNTQSAVRAFHWAESGQSDAWDYIAGDFDAAALGDTGTFSLNGRTFDWEIVQEMDESQMGIGEEGFLVRSIGFFGGIERTTVATYSRIQRPLATASALSLHPAGSVTLKGNSTISGYNHDVPADFDCNGTGCAGSLNGMNDTIGVYSDTDVGDITTIGSPTLEGAPATQNGGGACDQACWTDWAANIAPLATVQNGARSDGTIDWGTRTDPVIHVIDQNMHINGGLDGAGILIIDNANVTIDGNFHFEGLVVVVGSPSVDLTIGGTARIFGSVVAASPDASIDVGASGTPGILYSLEALGNLDNLIRVRRLAWFEEMN